MSCLIEAPDYGDYGNYNDFSSTSIYKARKQHVCDECNRVIKQGEKYEVASGKWNGDFYSYKTCSDCLSLRETFFCSYYFGSVWDSFFEEFQLMYERDDPALYRLDNLTPRTRKRIFDWIEEYEN